MSHHHKSENNIITYFCILSCADKTYYHVAHFTLERRHSIYLGLMRMHSGCEMQWISRWMTEITQVSCSLAGSNGSSFVALCYAQVLMVKIIFN